VKEMEKPKRDIHGDHQKFAVGKIDDVHHAENNRQPQCHNGQDHAEQKTGDDGA